MPNPNGTAVVMKFVNILELEQYLYPLSIALHANLFQSICKASKQKSKHVKGRKYVQKKRLSVETGAGSLTKENGQWKLTATGK